MYTKLIIEVYHLFNDNNYAHRNQTKQNQTKRLLPLPIIFSKANTYAILSYVSLRPT